MKWLRRWRWHLDVQNQRFDRLQVLHYKCPCGTNTSTLSGPPFLQRCLYYCLPMVQSATHVWQRKQKQTKKKKQLETSFQKWHCKKNGTCRFCSHDAMYSVSVRANIISPKFWPQEDNNTTKSNACFSCDAFKPRKCTALETKLGLPKLEPQLHCSSQNILSMPVAHFDNRANICVGNTEQQQHQWQNTKRPRGVQYVLWIMKQKNDGKSVV